MIRPILTSAPDLADLRLVARALRNRNGGPTGMGANDPDGGANVGLPARPGSRDPAGFEFGPVAAPRHAPAHASWGVLAALTARLRSIADGPRRADDPAWRFGTASVRTDVLDCAAQLDQLQVTLAHELALRQQLELAVFDAQTALAQARAELVGTQAGERHARHLARHDSLTALPNRGFFGERLAQALAAAAPRRRALAVMYLDLDDFKPINDAYGHATGDEVLRIVAARLSRTVRSEDTVGRLGGDEFACLLEGLQCRVQLDHLACKVFDAVAAPCKIGMHQLRVRASIGIAMCPEDGLDADALLRNADAAMYNAKRQQSGYSFFDEAAQGWSPDSR